MNNFLERVLSLPPSSFGVRRIITGLECARCETGLRVVFLPRAITTELYDDFHTNIEFEVVEEQASPLTAQELTELVLAFHRREGCL